MKKARFHRRLLLLCAGSALLGACSTMPAVGPSSRAVMDTQGQPLGDTAIRIVDLTNEVAQQAQASTATSYFAQTLGDGTPLGSIIGKGDVLEISIWEAPPATLFGSAGSDLRGSSAASTARPASIPEQMVDSDGFVTVPFAGKVPAAGRSPQQIGRDIASRLAGMAHQPQVIVRLLRNSAQNVTIVGDVASSMRVPLTSRGERLLDILATAGGVRQPIGKMTIQVTRGERIASMPLEAIIRDPRQNIRLQADDVVTALFQPYSFTALGGIGRNDEIVFEGTGISLAQALGRVSGLQDTRADVKGVFIFRLEPAADPAAKPVPVIYRVNMKDPATFFLAQNFPIRNKDVLYVSNAPLADLQKFVNVISSTILPAVTTATVLP